MASKLLLFGALILAFTQVILGLLLAVVILPPTATIIAIAVGGIGGGLGHSVLAGWAGRPDRAAWPRWTARIRVPSARWHSIIYGAVLLLAAAGSLAFFGPIALSAWAVFGVLIAVACLAADSLKAGLGPPPEEPSYFSTSETETAESCSAGYPASTPRTEQEWAEELHGWSDHALCWAWRTS